MVDFCAKICANESSVGVEKNHNRHVCMEDSGWWILQMGEQASHDLSILEYFQKDPLNAAQKIKKDCAYVALRKCDQALFIVRDPFGFIPIRYARTKQGWIVWTGPDIPKEVHKRVNYERLVGFIAHRTDVFEGGYFVGIDRILPGHCIRFTSSELLKHRYYKPDATYSEKSLERLSSDFREALFSEIPPSDLLALSGGLDSSALLAGMEGNPQTHTMFSSRFKSADERDEVATLSAFFGVKNTLFDVQKNKLWTAPDQFDDTNYQGYGPIFHPPVFGEQAFFASMLEDGEGPIITGIGGDNALDVSPNLVARRRIETGDLVGLKSLWRKYPSVVKQQIFKTPARKIIPSFGLQKTSFKDHFPWLDYPLKSAKAFSDQWGESRRDRILSWSWEQVTRLLDSHSRAIGRPILSPWMSSSVWDILVRVPPEMLFHHDRHKGFLRHAMKGFLPEEIRTAGKSKHFGKPTEYQFLEFEDQILGLFDESSLGEKKLIDVVEFRRFFGNQLAGIRENLENDIPAPTMLTWPTIAAEIWLKQHS